MSTLTSTPITFEPADAWLPSGLRLRYQHGGPSDGPAVLMLHGLSDSSFSFSRLVPYLPPHLRVIVPDQRGHGDSERPESGYDVDAFAEDALQLLDLLRVNRAVVVGHCMGSFVARCLAEFAPSRVSRLVLVGTALTARNTVIADLLAAVAEQPNPVDEAFAREFQTSGVARELPAEFMDRVVADSRRVPVRVWQAVLQGLLAWEPRWPLACPTRILGGEDDPVFSRDEQARLFHRTERATLHLEPGIGHALHWEAPERFVALAFAGI